MPAQKPSTSKQNYGTPRPFLDAVEHRYGPILFDLAAEAGNAVVPGFFDLKRDSLKQDWDALHDDGHHGWLWLNPPFSDIPAFVAKCVEETKRGCRILMLVPASVGANWFRVCTKNAHVVELGARMSFDGKDPYPKDLALVVFAHRLTGRSYWKWTKDSE
jgi:phage N-6-adenine-methyltransferase